MCTSKQNRPNLVAIMQLYNAVTALYNDQMFEARKKNSLKRFYHKPEEVDCLKIAFQFYSQTLWSGLTIMVQPIQLNPQFTLNYATENKWQTAIFTTYS